MISAVAVPRSGPRTRTLKSALLTLVVAAIGLLFLGASCADEESIDRLTIVNRTPFDVNVEVSDAKKESWLILGQATHGTSTVNELVTDMGPTWVFRFHYGGETVGELTLVREELERARWRFEVPSAVTDQMRKLGFEPPPDE
jgi:hypothetical protein